MATWCSGWNAFSNSFGFGGHNSALIFREYQE